jgi:uncharacterized RDD family membrane protein YckC
MSEYERYVPARPHERALILLFHIFLLAILVFPITQTLLVELGIDGIKKETAQFFILTVLIICFCIFPESPGKRMGGFIILDANGIELNRKRRFIRTSPYLLLSASMTIQTIYTENGETNLNPLTYFTLSIMMLSLLFILANGIAMFFTPNATSLIDMKLGTKVVKPPKPQKQYKPKI